MYFKGPAPIFWKPGYRRRNVWGTVFGYSPALTLWDPSDPAFGRATSPLALRRMGGCWGLASPATRSQREDAEHSEAEGFRTIWTLSCNGVWQARTFMPRKSLDNGLDAVRLAARQPRRSHQGRPGCQNNGIKGSHCQGNRGINVRAGGYLITFPTLSAVSWPCQRGKKRPSFAGAEEGAGRAGVVRGTGGGVGGEVKETPHNAHGTLTVEFQPPADCKNLNYPPSNPRFLQFAIG